MMEWITAFQISGVFAYLVMTFFFAAFIWDQGSMINASAAVLISFCSNAGLIIAVALVAKAAGWLLGGEV